MGTEVNWEGLDEFAQRRAELNPAFLRFLLAKALRRRSYGAVLIEKDLEDEKASDLISGLFAMAVLWGFIASLALALGNRWYHWIIAVVSIFVLVGIAAKLFPNSAVFGAILAVAWITLGVMPLVTGDPIVSLVAYGLPLAGIGLYAVSTRALRLRDAQDVALALGGVIKSAPLVAPVVLIVLFLPALNADVWEVAESLSASSLLLLGAASVGLLFIVVRLQLGSEVERMLEQRSTALCDLPDRAHRTRRGISQSVEEEDAKVLEGIGDHEIERAWPAEGEEYAPYLSAAAGGVLQGPLTARLALTVSVIAVLLAGYIYILISAGIPGSLASSWSHSDVASTEVSFLGATVTLHGGPYLRLAGLLGLAATATFLSFALVEERFASALTEALLRKPTDQFLLLALPYLSLREQLIDAELAERYQDSPGGG
jgi:hypothetical protein